MRLILLLFFIISTIYPKSITGYDLYRSLNKKSSLNISDRNQYISATAYIMGVINALKFSRDIYENVIANDSKETNQGKGMGNYLMPLNKEWSQNQYVEIVHFYLRKNPTKLNLSAVEIISLSLFEVSILNSLKL